MAEKKKTDKYTTSDIQNEIMKIMAMKVLHNLIAPIQAATFICIMADETTDAANKEQVVVCLRWVDNALRLHWLIQGRVNRNIRSSCRDVFKRLDIPIVKFKGNAMMELQQCLVLRQMLQSRYLMSSQKQYILIDCYGHSLNLACSDTIRQSKIIV